MRVREADNAAFYPTASLALIGYLFPCHILSGRTVPSMIFTFNIYIYTREDMFPCLAVLSNLGSNAGQVGGWHGTTRWNFNLATQQTARASKLLPLQDGSNFRRWDSVIVVAECIRKLWLPLLYVRGFKRFERSGPGPLAIDFASLSVGARNWKRWTG